MTHHFKTRHIKKALVLISALFLFMPGCTPERANTDATPERVISTAPSITETLFELGLTKRVIGVTRYCDYPDAAATIDRVGGLMDPNYEEIVALKPDLVILLTSNRDASQKLRKLGIKTLEVPHETITDIHRSIELIANTCGVPDKAAALLQKINARVEAIRSAITTHYRPRVMICIGRDTRTEATSEIYVAGRNNFYDEIINAAGGINVYRDRAVAYPHLSAEGIIQLDPEVIIDLAGSMEGDSKKPPVSAGQWDRLSPVAAVRNRRVHLITGTHTLRPGPRYVMFLEEVARLLHPEAFREMI